jgi:membrane-bound lytic murein transglycosylase F
MVLLVLCLTQCAPEPTALEAIRGRGELRVATLTSPSSWYQGTDGPQGLEYELAQRFATRLGVRLVAHPVATEAALVDELASGRADLVAAHLAYGPRWVETAAPARPYDEVAQVVIYPRRAARPTDLAALVGHRVAVAAASPQAQILSELKANAVPELRWSEVGTADPLAEVAAGRADYAVVDVTEFAFARQLYPDLATAFELSRGRPAQWLLPRRAADLARAVNAFFVDLDASRELREILARTGGEVQRFQFQAARELIANIAERLPGLQQLFETASARTGVDWRLLAAIGYQESQWNPEAISPNGAEGIMMLMPDTADELGVEDREDPRESIMAGARYFTQVRARVPERIPEPDRTWLALAAYNVGYGHLEDARILTQMNGGNPDRWADVREHLPLLANESWYPLAKRGFARGSEPVKFVDRIQGFLNVLEWRSSSPPVIETARRPHPAVRAEASG